MKRRPIYAYYLLLADSFKPILGTCQKKVNNHWLSCDSWHPKGARHVWGHSVKCLGLIAGVFFTRPTPSSAPYFSHTLPVSFPSRTFWETQATSINTNRRTNVRTDNHVATILLTTIKASDTLEHQPTVWPVPYACAQPISPRAVAAMDNCLGLARPHQQTHVSVEGVDQILTLQWRKMSVPA